VGGGGLLDQLPDIKQAVDGAVRGENETAKHFAKKRKLGILRIEPKYGYGKRRE
jgi:hypothetical protein